jgi:hypothetical protein
MAAMAHLRRQPLLVSGLRGQQLALDDIVAGHRLLAAAVVQRTPQRVAQHLQPPSPRERTATAGHGGIGRRGKPRGTS